MIEYINTLIKARRLAIDLGKKAAAQALQDHIEDLINEVNNTSQIEINAL